MSKKCVLFAFVFCLSALLLILPQGTSSSPLPKATQELLKKLKLDPSILANIDKELQVPGDWMEKAKKERNLKILSSSSAANPREIKDFYRPFKERYPFIALEQSGGSQRVRAVKTLIAFKTGRIVADIVFSIGGAFYKFKEANALEDLHTIPSVRNVPEHSKDPGGLWVSSGTRYYCMAYNTKFVDKRELPRSWEDIITNSRWRDGNLAVANRPQLWVMNLWKAKGQNWTKNFVTRLFTEVKPQLRKEGLNATLELLAAGEFHAAIPAQTNLVYQKVLNGAPISFNCPEPVLVRAGNIVVLKGAPNLYAARLFLNWLLSKEGQISQYFARNVPPVHKDLISVRELIPFGEQILGKKAIHSDPGHEIEILPDLYEFWNGLWFKGRERPR